MVNYKRVVCVLAVVTAVVAAPAQTDTHYDQRQNGTENYRLNIDGVVIAVAPADSLLAAASEIDFGDLLSELEDFNDIQKPKPPTNEKPPHVHVPNQDHKPQEGKPEDVKPETPTKPVDTPISDVSMSNEVKSQRKEASLKKQEKAQRLKNRLAHILLPLLRRTRHH